jgi:cation:H+ antiporter
MLGASAICLPIFFTGLLIRRWEGAVFFSLYLLYTAYLVLSAGESPLLPTFSKAVLFGIVPLVAFVLLAATLREFRMRARTAG